MKVLVACEESQRVATAFRLLGHEAYSADIQPCSGGHPEYHILGDCIPLINGNCTFRTMDDKAHKMRGGWDMLIAHPPCTYLTVTGNRWFNVELFGESARKRLKLREEAVDFFMKFVNADCPKIAIENPVGTISTFYRPPDQIIQPYWFGEPVQKKTCLWLKGLPMLKPTHIVAPDVVITGGKKMSYMHYITWNISDRKERAKERSKTLPGVARAFAEQWGGNIKPEDYQYTIFDYL